VWTSRDAAARCGVTQVTALADLAALVKAGSLEPVGRGRTRAYAVGRVTPTAPSAR